MRRFVEFIYFLTLAIALSCTNVSAAPTLFTDFDSRDFTPAEITIIQRSLTFAGYYDGLWDAKWGKISQRALERYAHDRFDISRVVDAVLPTLVLESLTTMNKLEWGENYFKNFGVRLGIPTAIVTLDSSVPDALEFYGAGVTIRIFVSTPSVLSARHADLAGDENTAKHYLVRRSGRWVTTTNQNGESRYLRSDYVGGRWVSLYVEGPVRSKDVMRYVTDSYVVGPSYEVNADTIVNLMALLEQSEALGAANGEQTDGAPSSAPGDIVSTGSGFFISNSTLVTNSHVVSGCGSLTDPSGTALHIVLMDKDLDLALLRFDGFSANFLSLSNEASVSLGEPVYALGYPYYGMINTELNFTNGVASAVNGLADDPNNFTLTAAFQPGNSGGPIVDKHGNVVGVAVAFADALTIADRTGTVPQNINFAIKTSALVSFLSKLGASYSEGKETLDMGKGVPRAMQKAVIPILCRK